MIQKEGMDIVLKLLIQSLQCFENVHISWSILFLLDQREGRLLCRHRPASEFLIGSLNYVNQTHIKDSIQALVLLFSFLQKVTKVI